MRARWQRNLPGEVDVKASAGKWTYLSIQDVPKAKNLDQKAVEYANLCG